MLNEGQIRQALDRVMAEGAAQLTKLADQGETEAYIWHCRDLAKQLEEMASNLREESA